MRITTLAVLLALAGCGAGEIKQQKEEIADFKAQVAKLEDQVRDKDNQIAALASSKADAEAEVQQRASDLKTLQNQLDQEKKDNEALYSSAETNRNDLVDKLRIVVKKKSAIAAALADAEKEKSRLTAKLQKTGFDLAALQKKADDLQARLDKIDADKAAVEKARTDRLSLTHEQMGQLADPILKELQSEQAKISDDGGVITLTLQSSLLFGENQAKLTEPGAALLERLAKPLKEISPRVVRVQGHTDNAPIKWELFGHFTSHWDLSAAQATAVARFLHEHAGLDPAKLQAEGCGEFRPAKSNATEEGRASNRRVVFVIEPAS